MKRSLTRKERLSGKKEIERLFESAAMYEHGGLKLLVRANGLGYNRVLITARRGFFSAVARNRQKRILREIYRNRKNALPQGLDLAFILRKEGPSFDDMRLQLARLLEKAGLANGVKRPGAETNAREGSGRNGDGR